MALMYFGTVYFGTEYFSTQYFGTKYFSTQYFEGSNLQLSIIESTEWYAIQMSSLILS